MLTLLHVSDLHFGPPFVPEVGEALLRIAPRLRPDAVVVTGDVTQRAKPEQFAEARAFFDRLPDARRVVLPGNHDIALLRVVERLLRPYDAYREHLGDHRDRVFELPGAVLVALNSTAPRRAISNGRIDDHQLRFCSESFTGVPPETLRIVAAHHHFTPAPDYARDRPMPRSKRALDRLVALKVDLILGGHLHRAYIGNSLDVYRGADPEHGTIVVQCGTTTSRRGRAREREKNSFNLLQLDAERIRVTHYIYFHDRDAFAATSRHEFPRPAAQAFADGGEGG